MKELRPFQLILIAVFALLALFSVFLFANFSGRNEGQETGKVVIWGTLAQAGMDAGLDELKSGNDNFSDVSYVERSATTFSRDLADAIASGAGPDLIIISQEDLLSERPKLMPIPYASLSERLFVDSYLSLFEIYLSPEGVYGVPLAADPVVLYYNRATLESAGIAQAPTTWEGIAGLAPGIVRRAGDSVITKALLPFGEYGNVRNARAILSTLFLQAGSSITVEEDRGVRSALGSQGAAAGAAESALNFYTQFADPAKTVYSWNRSLPESRAVFVAGDLALYPGMASELPYLLSANPNLDFEMAPIPQPGTSATRTTYAHAYAFAVPKASANPTGAMSTAFALSAEGPVRAMTDVLSMAPALRSLIAEGSQDRYDAISYADALVAKAWLSPAPQATDALFSAMIGNVVSGRMDASQALISAGESLNAVLR